MKMRTLISALLFTLIVTADGARGQAVTLATGDKSDNGIAVPDSKSGAAMVAATAINVYVRHMTGAILPVRISDGSGTNKTIVVAKDPAQQGISITTDGTRVFVKAGTDAELVHAAYLLLDELGCRFLAPQFDHYGGQAEIVPHKDVLALNLPIASKPQLSYRKLYIEEGISHDEANLKQLIEWMPKVGYNVLVCPMDYGNRGRVKWDNWRDALTPELQKRGLTIEVGGHGYENFLNAGMEGGKLFEQHPEWFGADEKGARRKAKHYAFCTSNAAAVDYVTKNFLDYVAKRPEIQIFDFWPPDGAIWCACDQCKTLGDPPERQAKLLSHVSEAVAKVRPDLKLEAIAYSKLIEPPKVEKIDKNVLIDFCPIAQNFEFTLDDPAGHGMREDGSAPRANKQYFDALQAWRQRFDGPISIYSYYRRYAWDSLPLVLPWHMKHEMAWYGSIPTHGISSYSEPGDWSSYELNHYVLPALAWDRDQDVDAIVKKFADARYGSASPAAVETYKALADVVRKYCSVPFVSLKDEAEIDAAAKRVDAVAKDLSAARGFAKDDARAGALKRLALLVEYVQRDLAVQKMRAAKAPREQIRERIATDHKWLSDHANDGVFLVKGNRLTLNRAYTRYGVNDKSATTAPAE
jgi:hypothetical protein